MSKLKFNLFEVFIALLLSEYIIIDKSKIVNYKKQLLINTNYERRKFEISGYITQIYFALCKNNIRI